MPSEPPSLSNFGGMSSFAPGSDSPFGHAASSANGGNYGNSATTHPSERNDEELTIPFAVQPNPFESNAKPKI